MSTSCEICDNNSLFLLFKKEDYYYEKCLDCGLIRIHPQPTDQALEDIYQNDYYAAWGKYEDIFRSLKQKTFSSILNMVPEKSRGGKLLDVGAATGILMDVAQEQGYESYGVEVASDGVETIEREFGAERVFTGYFDQIDFAAAGMMGKFDIVTMIDTLEHVRDPNEALRKVYSLLKPKGYLLLYFPNTASWTARIFGKRWNYYCPEHLFSFSQDCISQILLKHSFKVCRLEAAPKYLTIEYFNNVLERIPGSIGFLRSFLAHSPSALKRIPIPLYVGQMKILAQKEEG